MVPEGCGGGGGVVWPNPHPHQIPNLDIKCLSAVVDWKISKRDLFKRGEICLQKYASRGPFTTIGITSEEIPTPSQFPDPKPHRTQPTTSSPCLKPKKTHRPTAKPTICLQFPTVLRLAHSRDLFVDIHMVCGEDEHHEEAAEAGNVRLGENKPVHLINEPGSWRKRGAVDPEVSDDPGTTEAAGWAGAGGSGRRLGVGRPTSTRAAAGGPSGGVGMNELMTRNGDGPEFLSGGTINA